MSFSASKRSRAREKGAGLPYISFTTCMFLPRGTLPPLSLASPAFHSFPQHSLQIGFAELRGLLGITFLLSPFLYPTFGSPMCQTPYLAMCTTRLRLRLMQGRSRSRLCSHYDQPRPLGWSWCYTGYFFSVCSFIMFRAMCYSKECFHPRETRCGGKEERNTHRETEEGSG
jgi:hypothetical protein